MQSKIDFFFLLVIPSEFQWLYHPSHKCIGWCLSPQVYRIPVPIGHLPVFTTLFVKLDDTPIILTVKFPIFHWWNRTNQLYEYNSNSISPKFGGKRQLS